MFVQTCVCLMGGGVLGYRSGGGTSSRTGTLRGIYSNHETEPGLKMRQRHTCASTVLAFLHSLPHFFCVSGAGETPSDFEFSLRTWLKRKASSHPERLELQSVLSLIFNQT